MSEVMNRSDWERWVTHIGSQVDDRTAVVCGRTVVNGESELRIDDETYHPDMVVPKANGLEIHEGDDVTNVSFRHETAKRRMTVEKHSDEGDLEWTLLVDDKLSMTPGERRGVDLALEDLTKIQVTGNVEVPRFKIILTSDPNDVVGSCGEFKNGNECWVAVKECASRGYSDYRWRVNRTPHGVIIHELGHYIHGCMTGMGNRLGRDGPGTVVTNRELKETFPPESDITNYSDKNYRENLAESWRVFVTNPELLRAINQEKYDFWSHFFAVPENEDMLEYSIPEMTGVIKSQLESASTNAHIRDYLGWDNE